MVDVYSDFHIHIGRSCGKPVKIAAAPSLTLAALVEHARLRKGLDIVTVIDGVCDGPLVELRSLLAAGHVRTLPGGGLMHENGLVILIGAEIEAAGPSGGAAHFGCWFPCIETASDFASWLKTVQKNTSLSSQRARVSATELQRQTVALGGLFIIHHAFTPHKGLYGSCVTHLKEMVNPAQVHALELGLSADSNMADRVSELKNVTYLSNSDAHSVQKIAREYNRLHLDHVDFSHVRKALTRIGDNRVSANFGLNPLLGKYHLSACAKCGKPAVGDPPACGCGSTRFTTGVSRRLEAIADLPSPVHPDHRPLYVHQIPLEFVPGLGPKAMQRLFDAFGSEMNILHQASVEDLEAVVGPKLAQAIDNARQGRSTILPGAGGVYGRIEGLST